MVNKIFHSLYPIWLCRLFKGTNFSVLFCFSFFRLHSPHLWQQSINLNKNKWTNRQTNLHILICWSRLLSVKCFFFFHFCSHVKDCIFISSSFRLRFPFMSVGLEEFNKKDRFPHYSHWLMLWGCSWITNLVFLFSNIWCCSVPSVRIRDWRKVLVWWPCVTPLTCVSRQH